jgi:uncharacterized protein (TIGR02001 family)
MWKAGLLGALSLASIAPALAQDSDEGDWGPFTAGVTVTSDYRFRGISNSDRDAAFQPWIQYDHSSGVFANIWASTIDFNDTATYDSSVEVDFTLGYNHKFGENTTASIKAVYYWYADADTPPGLTDYDYFELILGASHDFGRFSASAEVDWSPDYFLETDDAVSVTGGVEVPILDSFAFFDGGLTASANVGYQWIDNNVLYGTPDYFYYDIGATASWGIFSFDVRWQDTDLSRAQCYGGLDLCEGGIVLSVSADLPG